MSVTQRYGEGHRILVSGGAGFVPSHVVDALLARGCEVVAIDNFVTGSRDNVAHLADRAAVHAGRGGHHATGLPALPGRFDAILHMASPASPTDFAKLPVEILKVGSVGTMALLDRAVADAARFLMASTSEAYGDPLVHPQPESYWGNVNPIGVRSVYDESKRFSEAATMAYHRFHGLDTAIVRIFNTYGPRMRPRRRPGHPHLHQPGAARRPDHRAGHRHTDPLHHLRRRPGPRDPAAARLDRDRPDQLRHRARADHARAGRADRPADRQHLDDRAGRRAPRTTRRSAAPT